MGIQCLRFKQYEKGHLRGFCDLYIDKWDIEIHGCSIYEKNGGRWIVLPGKEFENEAGEKKWKPFITFRNAKHKDLFVKLAMESVKDWWIENKDKQVQNASARSENWKEMNLF